MAEILLNLMFAWFAALAAIVFYRLINGQIRTTGLLNQTLNGPRSPERVQLMIGSTMALGYYLTLSLSSDPSTGMPEPPIWVLAMVGGSQSVYLLGKWFRRPGE